MTKCVDFVCNDLGLILLAVRTVRELPAEDGSVLTDADDVLLIRTDLEAGDRSAVPKSNVCHCSLLVQPNLLITYVQTRSNERSM